MEYTSDNLASNLQDLTIDDDPPVTSAVSSNADSGFAEGSEDCIFSIVSGYKFEYQEEAKNWYLPDEEGDNDLLIALTHNSDYERKVAALIIDNAPDSSYFNARNNDGLVAIIIAATRKDLSAIRRLRLAGADPNISDGLGNRGLHYAAFYGNRDVLLTLATKISPEEVDYYGSPLQRVIQDVDLDVRNCDGKTPLHLAVEREQIEIIKTLRNFGVNPNLTENSSGRAALHEAVERGFITCATELLKIPTIDVNACTYAGRTPLDCTQNLTDDVRSKMEELLKSHGAQSGTENLLDSDDDSEM